MSAAKNNVESYWTPGKVGEVVEMIAEVVYAEFMEAPGNAASFHKAVMCMNSEDRVSRIRQMTELCKIMETYRAALSCYSTCSLIGVNADRVQLANLLGAVDPNRLSTDVIDHLISDVAPHFALSSLPQPLYKVLCDHVAEQGEE